ncbi:MAG: GIY-YIG nuclease family protein [Motiliproteus sp.]|nr:GIY-YIG nuclease family protein [Motiliproteus sp.]
MSKGTESSDWFLYIIETQSGRLYTGITTDIQRRFSQHQQGKGAKFFRTDPPSQIRFQQRFGDRSEASKEEARIKKLTRIKKLQLIASEGDQTIQHG